MGDLDFITIISLSIIFLLGCVILLIGYNRRQKSTIGLGFAFVLGGGLVLFVESTEFRELLIALATVSIAVVAAISIDESRRLRKQNIEQEKRRREEEQAREQRNRDERLLNEIIGWATDVARCRLERDIKEVLELKDLFEAETLKSVYIMNIVEPFTLSLKKAVLKLNGALLEHVELMSKYDEYKKSDDKDKRSEQVEKIRSHNSEISTIFVQVIDEATKAKINLLSH